ncbi:hypothetical protein MPER_07832 [Moniliophthora perniciosa FA553]|nr:hypothetical protein MPER_07832 [Moniliophthora perniciosa FA553]
MSFAIITAENIAMLCYISFGRRSAAVADFLDSEHIPRSFSCRLDNLIRAYGTRAAAHMPSEEEYDALVAMLVVFMGVIPLLPLSLDTQRVESEMSTLRSRFSVGEISELSYTVQGIDTHRRFIFNNHLTIVNLLLPLLYQSAATHIPFILDNLSI